MKIEKEPGTPLLSMPIATNRARRRNTMTGPRPSKSEVMLMVDPSQHLVGTTARTQMATAPRRKGYGGQVSSQAGHGGGERRPACHIGRF